MKTRAKIGDIIEFQTRKGFGYAQFSHYHSVENAGYYGSLIRVMPGVFASRPVDFEEFVAGKEAFFTFFHVQGAINKKLVSLVGHLQVPDHAKEFPLFRCDARNPDTGKVAAWWLWDGHKEWKVGGITEEQLDLSIREIPSYGLLLQRIEEGWTPRRAQEFEERARAAATEPSADSGGPAELHFFLIFEDCEAAERVAGIVRGMKLEATVTELDPDWGVNVLYSESCGEAPESMPEILERLAEKEGGLYDGLQVKLAS